MNEKFELMILLPVKIGSMQNRKRKKYMNTIFVTL